MPARDAYHSSVKKALIKDGWTITHDPLFLRFLGADMLVDLGAKRLIAADLHDKKIAVEIKSFLRASPLTEFHEALGQIMNYRVALANQEPDRILYLAVPIEAYETFFATQFGQFAIDHFELKIIVYSVKSEEITKWIP